MNDYFKLISLVLSSIEFCILVVYFHDKLYKKRFSNSFYLIYLIFYIILNIFVHMLEIPIVNVIFSVISIMITSILYKQDSFKKFFIYDLLLFVVLLVVEMVVSAVFGIFDINLRTYLLDGELFFISSIVILIINICCCKVLVGKIGKYKWQNIQWLEVIFSVILCFFETIGIIYLAKKTVNDGNKGYVLLFFGLSYFFVICYQLYASHIMQLFYDKRRKQEIEDNSKQILDKHYELLEEKNERYKRLEHDIYKHLNTLEVLSQGNNGEIISNYIMDVKDKIINLKEIFVLRNKVLQILINELYQKALEENIECQFDVVDMDLSFLNSYDVTTLFGNLFDNAYAACLLVDQEQRFINMHLYKFNNFIIFCISNSYTGTWKSNMTFKDSDKGIGLKNVTDVIDKYYGNIEILKEQKEFKVKIVLPVN